MDVKTFRFMYRVLLISAFTLGLPSILAHFTWLMGGEGLSDIVSSRWDIAGVNIAFFLVFLGLVRYKKKVKWRTRNIYTAFIIALFAEMYGFPLTAYLLSRYIGPIPSNNNPQYSITIGFMGEKFILPTMMIIGSAITIAGLLLIAAGWYTVYSKKEGIVTTGLYRFMRHPQYTGILMVTFGWIIHWPTFLTLSMWPIMALIYYRLARCEEEEIKKRYPEETTKYLRETPMFL